MTRSTKQTGASQHALRSAECQKLLRRIANQLKKHQKRQEQELEYLAFTGKFDSVSDGLAKILASLGNSRACEVKGIKYWRTRIPPRPT